MASKRYDIVVPDPDAVFLWLEEHVKSAVVRKIGYKTQYGWYMKIVLDEEAACAVFEANWVKDETNPKTTFTNFVKLRKMGRK